MTSHIVVLGFEGKYVAEGLLESIEQLEKEGLAELEDAVLAQRGPGNHVEIKQARSQTGKTALKVGGAGLLAGLLLGGPIGGLVAGAAIGAITGKLKNYGLDDKFVKDISAGLRPNSSALFLLIRKADVDAFIQRLRGYEIKLMMTSLSPEQQKKVEAALNA